VRILVLTPEELKTVKPIVATGKSVFDVDLMVSQGAGRRKYSVAREYTWWERDDAVPQIMHAALDPELAFWKQVSTRRDLSVVSDYAGPESDPASYWQPSLIRQIE
jgi:hypothetical protein